MINNLDTPTDIQDELETKAHKLLDEILLDKEVKEQLKISFINLLLFGEAKFEYKTKVNE